MSNRLIATVVGDDNPRRRIHSVSIFLLWILSRGISPIHGISRFKRPISLKRLYVAGLHQCHTRKPAGAQEKIAFDKLHVAKYFGAAVDKVRRQEHKALMAQGFEDLKGSKYDWLYNPDNMTRKQKQRFKVLRDSTLKAALNALSELTKKTQVILFTHHSQVVKQAKQLQGMLQVHEL